MTSGMPDWYKSVAQLPVVSIHDWIYQGYGMYTTSDYNVVDLIEHIVAEDLGGKTVYFYSFKHTGWMVWTRATPNVHSFLGKPFVRCMLLDPDDNDIGGFAELDTPVLKENVDDIVVHIILPLDRIADASNPAYIQYLVTFSLAYKIL